MSEAIAQKLDEARALIEKGWTQGAYHRRRKDWRFWLPRDRYCMQGALCAVASRGEYHYFRQVIGEGTYVAWNDKLGRTQAEVIEAFRKAAELARGVTEHSAPIGEA